MTVIRPFREVSFGPVNVIRTVNSDGSVILESKEPLEAHPVQITNRLIHWAQTIPQTIFLGQRSGEHWETISYAETLDKVRSVSQYLLKSRVDISHPLAILSDNSLEHALMGLGAMHVGLPYSPISPAYSLRSTDYIKLKHVIDLLTPGAVFVSDGQKYESALMAIAHHDAEIIVGKNPCREIPCTMLSDILTVTPTAEVDEAYENIEEHTIAKILFTSGSTGLPKGVINTHGNISANWQQITQTFPFFKEEFKIIDWLPWNHTFGGNHNFGLTLYNGGTMYIDGGKPTPGGIKTTIQNLKEFDPTVYFNVPKGFSELLRYLKADEAFRKKFFSKVKILFYAGAGMPQHLWKALEDLALETVGERILVITGLGCTEACPSALFSTTPDGKPGLIGVPVPGLKLKLVPVSGKLEARYRGPNIFPGYWRNNEVTEKAFDEDNYYCTGDALRFCNELEPDEGLYFDGRIVEDFKLDTGTWVHVGNIRSQLLVAGNGLIHDAVITGHDLPFVGAILFLDLEICKRMFDLDEYFTMAEMVEHPPLINRIQEMVDELATGSTGSSTLIRKVLIADFDLSSDAGELTDKGSVNQRKVIETRSDKVNSLYSNIQSKLIITANV